MNEPAIGLSLIIGLFLINRTAKSRSIQEGRPIVDFLRLSIKAKVNNGAARGRSIREGRPIIDGSTLLTINPEQSRRIDFLRSINKAKVNNVTVL